MLSQVQFLQFISPKHVFLFYHIVENMYIKMHIVRNFRTTSRGLPSELMKCTTGNMTRSRRAPPQVDLQVFLLWKCAGGVLPALVSCGRHLHWHLFVHVGRRHCPLCRQNGSSRNPAQGDLTHRFSVKISFGRFITNNNHWYFRPWWKQSQHFSLGCLGFTKRSRRRCWRWGRPTQGWRRRWPPGQRLPLSITTRPWWRGNLATVYNTGKVLQARSCHRALSLSFLVFAGLPRKWFCLRFTRHLGSSEPRGGIPVLPLSLMMSSSISSPLICQFRLVNFTNIVM